MYKYTQIQKIVVGQTGAITQTILCRNAAGLMVGAIAQLVEQALGGHGFKPDNH